VQIEPYRGRVSSFIFLNLKQPTEEIRSLQLCYDK